MLYEVITRIKSVNSIKTALNTDRKIFLVAQKDVFVENPAINDVYKVGVVAEIKQIIKTPDNITRVLVEGLYKARLVNLEHFDDIELRAEIKRIPSISKAKFDENRNNFV